MRPRDTALLVGRSLASVLLFVGLMGLAPPHQRASAAQADGLPGAVDDDAPAAAHKGNYQIVPNNSSLLVTPELGKFGAPQWVKPGLQLVVHTIGGTISTNGGGGAGYTEYTVLSVQPDAVAIQVRLLVTPGIGGAPVVASSSGIVTTPSCALDLWIHPKVLAGFIDANAPGVTRSRTRYRAAGRTYDALSEQITSGQTTNTRVLDIDSGLGLHTAMSSTSGGSTSVAQSTLMSVRQIHVPWTTGHIPSGLENVRELVYQGEQQTMVPGVQLPPSPVRLTLKVIGKRPDFVQFERTGVMMIFNQPQDLGTSQLVDGPSMLTPIAVDPADMHKLKQGDQLDVNTVTKAETLVAFVGPNRQGRQIVVITETFPGQPRPSVEAVYDAQSGLSIGGSAFNPFLNQVTRIALVSKK